MRTIPDGLHRGPLTGEELAEVERLGARHLKPGQIARKLNRHPSTIKWRMLRAWLLTQVPRTIAGPYVTRGGIERHPWTPDQDRRLEELRTTVTKVRQIGEILTAEFGVPRNGHSCFVRLTMLAAAP